MKIMKKKNDIKKGVDNYQNFENDFKKKNFLEESSKNFLQVPKEDIHLSVLFLKSINCQVEIIFYIIS